MDTKQIYQKKLITPQRGISWWSEIDDLLWPAPYIRDRIKRRADKMVAAKIDTAVNFGFHFRFDYAPYFGSLHGYLRDVAENLHERGIMFLDHFSCNLTGRPTTIEEMTAHNTFQRHAVTLHPDSIGAETLSYAGVRFNDVREIDIKTGEPYYCSIYNCDLFCHNNPDFLEMHRQYLIRLMNEVPIDGMEADDMCYYGYFQTCGCHFCRERFKREYDEILPPLDNADFWGDTSKHPMFWGNYSNPAFRNWVQMRYKIINEHLQMVREVVGKDVMLKTCCSQSGPTHLNALALSYENVIDVCDWVNLENCGLSEKSANWLHYEAGAMLHKEVARTKPGREAPTVAIAYGIYDDAFHLGFAINRFWGVASWASTLWGRLVYDPVDAKDDADSIAPYNQWEVDNELPRFGDDVVDARLVYANQNKYHGYRDARGRDYFSQVSRWTLGMLKHNIGYRFMLTGELGDKEMLCSEMTPIILDTCEVLSDTELTALKAFADKGGKIIVRRPFGVKSHDGSKREENILDNHPNVFYVDGNESDLVGYCLSKGWIKSRITVNEQMAKWTFRLRITEKRLSVHMINTDLKGIPHPEDRSMNNSNVLHRIECDDQNKTVELEIDVSDLDFTEINQLKLYSPDFSQPDDVTVSNEGGKVKLTFNTNGMRIYGFIY